MDRLDIYIGCMFSGKSNELLKNLLNFAELGLSCLYINHKFDNRNKDHTFSTHHPFIIPKNYENINFVSVSSLKNLIKEEYDVIGIDEAQFFDESLIEFVKEHVETYKKHVIVVGLDADSKRQKFGYILDLIPLADTVTKLRGWCKDCGPKRKRAIHSYMLTENENQLSVGGSDKYKPLCRSCYLEINN